MASRSGPGACAAPSSTLVRCFGVILPPLCLIHPKVLWPLSGIFTFNASNISDGPRFGSSLRKNACPDCASKGCDGRRHAVATVVGVRHHGAPDFVGFSYTAPDRERQTSFKQCRPKFFSPMKTIQFGPFRRSLAQQLLYIEERSLIGAPTITGESNELEKTAGSDVSWCRRV